MPAAARRAAIVVLAMVVAAQGHAWVTAPAPGPPPGPIVVTGHVPAGPA